MSVLSGLYGRAAQLRRAWYGRHPHRVRHLARPVISVGNLVLGGSGKTPVVAALAGMLRAAGERPAILSRGYGRRRGGDGVVVVSDGHEVLTPAARSGDEPQMLARALAGVPVLVCPDRHLSGTLAERRFGCTVHLLDDGFQHVQMARDIDLLVMSRADLDERMLPSGTLREPLDAAGVADALLVPGTDEDAAAVRARVKIDAVFRILPRYHRPRLVEPFGVALQADTGRRVIAVAGIARPARFFAALRAEGWDVVREMVFRDHHWFTARDLTSIRHAAVGTQANLVITTEKDAMRMPLRPAEMGGIPWAFLPLDVVIEPADRFADWIAEQLAAARRRLLARRDGPPQRTVQPILAGRVAERPDPREGGEAA